MKTKEEIIFASFMSFITTFFVTLVIVSINVGFNKNFLPIWLRTWGIAFFLVGLSILYFAPVLRKFIKRKSNRCKKNEPAFKKQIRLHD